MKMRPVGAATRERVLPDVAQRLINPSLFGNEGEELLDLRFCFDGGFDFVTVRKLNPNLVLSKVTRSFIQVMLLEKLHGALDGRKLVGLSIQRGHHNASDVAAESFV